MVASGQYLLVKERKGVREVVVRSDEVAESRSSKVVRQERGRWGRSEGGSDDDQEGVVLRVISESGMLGGAGVGWAFVNGWRQRCEFKTLVAAGRGWHVPAGPADCAWPSRRREGPTRTRGLHSSTVHCYRFYSYYLARRPSSY